MVDVVECWDGLMVKMESDDFVNIIVNLVYQ